MKFLVFISLVLVSFFGYAQGGEGANGGGGPTITHRFLNLELLNPGYTDLLSGEGRTILETKRGYGELIEPDKCKSMSDKSKELCYYLKNPKGYKILKSPVDLEIKGAGVIDLQTFKDETPKSLWREDDDKIIIDNRVPVINWQDFDGEVHELD